MSNGFLIGLAALAPASVVIGAIVKFIRHERREIEERRKAGLPD
jgi:hypothetical protein